MAQCVAGEQLLKYTLIVVNITLLVISVSVIVSSFGSLHECELITVLTGSNSFTYGIRIIFVIAFINLLQVILAALSLLTNKFAFILAYAAFAVTMGALGALGGIIGRYMDYQAKNGIREWMEETLIAEYGHPYGDRITLAWDQLQTNYRCCGMMDGDGDRIWAESTWFRKQTKYPKKRVPLSCCTTCSVILERYCSMRSLSTVSEAMNLSDTFCAEVRMACESNSDNLQGVGLCAESSTLLTTWPKRIFLNTRGCFVPFKKQIEVYSARISSIGCLFATLLFICALIAFKLLNNWLLQQEYILAIGLLLCILS